MNMSFEVINISAHFVTLVADRGPGGSVDFHEACEELYRQGLKFIDRERNGDRLYFFCERLYPDVSLVKYRNFNMGDIVDV